MSVQVAIDGATDGDRVLVAAGTYVEQINTHGKSIAVIGMQGPAFTILDGGGVGPVVRFDSGEGPSTRLQGFTITGGAAGFGAGGVAVAAGATPSIEDCIIRNNTGKFGGGISGSPALRRCVIRNNTASLTHGGGIYGAPSMKYCVVANNTATSADGGGAYITGSTTIEDCLFAGNRAIFANSKGGGVYIHTSSPVTLARCVITHNGATGGVFAGVGGGVVAASGTTLMNCLVLGNTLSGSSLLGGGVYGAASLVNCIVRENTSPQLSSTGSVTYSDVEGGFTGVGNFDADPLFVDAVTEDFHLTANSPCVDAGDPTLTDPDASRSDVGPFPFARLNLVNPDWSQPSWPEVSVAIGGRQVLRIHAGGALGGQLYLTAGTLSGTTPGFSFLGQHVPLNPDAWFWFTVSNPNTPLLSSSFGTLSFTGEAEIVFKLPGDVTSPYAGTVLHHATLVGSSSGTLNLVTNPVELRLVD